MTIVDWMFEHPYLATLCIMAIAAGWPPLIYVKRDLKGGRADDGHKNAN